MIYASFDNAQAEVHGENGGFGQVLGMVDESGTAV